MKVVDMQSSKCAVCSYPLHKRVKVKKSDVSHNGHVLFVCDVYVFLWTSSGDGVNLRTETINHKLIISNHCVTTVCNGLTQ